jgi:hypothetical protein
LVADEDEVTQQTSTATFTNSIYQGNVDFVGESASAEKVKIVFDGSSDENWSINTSTHLLTVTVSDLGAKPKTAAISNMYENHTINASWDELANGQFSMHPSNSTTIGLIDNNFSGLEAWKTYLSSHNLEIVYELTTPTTETITPTNLPIKSLFGYNHIESSTGDMTIEYLTNYYQPLAEIIERGDMHKYSTVERVIGKWIDGKDLYEITLDITSPASINTNATVDSLASLSFDKIVSVEGMIYAAGVSQYVPIFWSYNTAIIGTVYIDGTNLKQIVSSATYCNCREWITIRYTKTS